MTQWSLVTQAHVLCDLALWEADLHVVTGPSVHVRVCKPPLALPLHQTLMHAWSRAQHGHAPFLWVFPLLWIFFVSDGLCGLFPIFPYLFLLPYHKKGSARNRISILTAEFPFPSSGHKSLPSPSARWVVCAR